MIASLESDDASYMHLSYLDFLDKVIRPVTSEDDNVQKRRLGPLDAVTLPV